MNTREEADLTTKILAVLGSLALGFTALINAILGTMALVAKLIALGFGILALAEFAAGEFLRRRLRNIIVPIACGMTVVGEAAFSIWAKHFTSLDAIMVICALFAFWTWYRLPRATSANDGRLGTLHATY